MELNQTAIFIFAIVWESLFGSLEKNLDET